MEAHNHVVLVRWKDIRRDFEADGACRDIVIEDPTEEVWEAAYRFMLKQPGAVYLYDLEPRPAPQTTADIFGAGEGHRSLLTGNPSGIEIRMFFFSEREIEFTVWPQDVTNETRLDALLTFMQSLSKASGGRVDLYHENDRSNPILSCHFGGQMLVVPLTRTSSGTSSSQSPSASPKPVAVYWLVGATAGGMLGSAIYGSLTGAPYVAAVDYGLAALLAVILFVLLRRFR